MIFFRKLLLAFSIIAFLVACSDVDSDAKKASSLHQKSMQATREYDLESASKYFQQYQEIVDKYKKTSDFNAFEAAYNKYENETK